MAHSIVLLQQAQDPLLPAPGALVSSAGHPYEDDMDMDEPPQRCAPAADAERTQVPVQARALAKAVHAEPTPATSSQSTSAAMPAVPAVRSYSATPPRARGAPLSGGSPSSAPTPVSLEGPSEALDNLATLDQDEADILMHCNAQDVEFFFRRKGVPYIGQALARNGVSGSSIHMLSPADIETKLNLNLGQQLALKNFIKQMQGVSRRRVEKVWTAEEASDKEEEQWHSGCCCCAWLCCYCNCLRRGKTEDRGVPTAKLRKAQYTLTSSELSIETWSWVDEGLTDREVPLRQTPNCGCGPVCGYTLEPVPQQCTITNNIDLSCIQDVDNRKFTAKAVAKSPNCMEFCCGYNETRVTPAATLMVTYVDRGSLGGARQGRQEFRVEPEVVQEITRKINAERDATATTGLGTSTYDNGMGGSFMSEVM